MNKNEENIRRLVKEGKTDVIIEMLVKNGKLDVATKEKFSGNQLKILSRIMRCWKNY